MRSVMTAHFTLFDTGLFLDSHPDCEQALEYYQQARRNYEAAAKEYEAKFGPLSFDSVTSEYKWAWTMDAWPWELEG